jgi:hypothetical protein
LFQKLLRGVLATEKDASCINAHVIVESIFVDLVDRLRIAGFAANTGIIYDAVVRSADNNPNLGKDLHVKLAICLYSLSDEGLPAGSVTDIDLDEDGFPALRGYPLMSGNLLTLAKGFEIGAHKDSTFFEELVTYLSTNALRRAGDDGNATMKTLTGHDRQKEG